MKYLILFFLFLFGILNLNLNLRTETPSPQTGWINGQCIDTADGRCIPLE